MPRILVDFEKMRHLECGLGQFSLELAWALLAERRPEDDLHYFLPEQHAPRFHHAKVVIKPVRRWQKAAYIAPIRDRVNRIIPGPHYDLWHVSNQCSWYEPWNARVPVVLTIHDLNFLREKTPKTIESYLYSIQQRINRATCITTISNFVAGEVRSHFDLQGKPLRVIYNGASNASAEDVKRPSYAPKEKFLFSIGDFMAKKNFHVLLEMIRFLPEYHLVLAGNHDTEYGRTIRLRASELGLENRVVLPGRISNADRQWLYAHCTAFGFPSITEGFGLPVIEAMYAGKPVFMSTATSLPEIGGSVGFYWKSYEPKAMASFVRMGLEEVEKTPEYPDRVRQHAAQFSWSLAARNYLSLYREIASGNMSKDARVAA